MTKSEYRKLIAQAATDLTAAMSRIVVPPNATAKQFNDAQKLRDAAEQNYVNASLAAQRAFRIKTPVALGRTE
jgi:hypothetical protein